MADAPPPEAPALARLMQIAEAIRTPWQPHPALTANQATLRVVKFQGHAARWHTHAVCSMREEQNLYRDFVREVFVPGMLAVGLPLDVTATLAAVPALT
jgi:hypothetical protein